MLILSEEDVKHTLSVAEAVTLAEKGIRADAAGRVKGDKFYLQIDDAGFIKPFAGHMAGEELAFVKTFSFFSENPQRYDRSTTSSLVLLFDAKTGYPVCLMQADWVTGLKTGASTTVTASVLARSDAERLMIFGAGLQGRMHLRAIATRFSLRHVSVLDINPEAADRFAEKLGTELNLPIESVSLDERERAVREADIIITVTTGNQALIELAWLKPGVFVARLGSYQEVAHEVIAGADKVIVDRWQYVNQRIPELKSLMESGRFAREDVYAEWPDVIAGRRPGRESQDEIIVFIALGIWGEYAALLPEVYRRARSLGIGKIVSL
jgi:ornithine cyclodeaminase/alanine dehydrogenase-like protein (mu-crystallin family)